MPFDLAKRAVVGPPVTLAESLAVAETLGYGSFSVASSSVLAYSQSDAKGGAGVVWLDEHGATSPLRTELAAFSNPRFSPDGQRLAMDVATPSRDLWIYDWVRDTPVRLTSGPTDSSAPVWSPDGRDKIGRAHV